jgi:hypothetical protein
MRKLEIVTRGAAVGFGENYIGGVGREERKIIINFVFYFSYEIFLLRPQMSGLTIFVLPPILFWKVELS